MKYEAGFFFPIMETMRKMDYKLRVSPEELQLRLTLLRAADDQQRMLVQAAETCRDQKLQRFAQPA